jgi:hypothetical protein
MLLVFFSRLLSVLSLLYSTIWSRKAALLKHQLLRLLLLIMHQKLLKLKAEKHQQLSN